MLFLLKVEQAHVTTTLMGIGNTLEFSEDLGSEGSYCHLVKNDLAIMSPICGENYVKTHVL